MNGDTPTPFFDLACAIVGAETPRPAGHAGTAPPDEGAAGGMAQPSPRTFPAELEALARELADEMRMSGAYNGLLDLIDRAKDERNTAKVNTPEAIIPGSILGAMVDLQLNLDPVIDTLARRAAIAEAQRIDEELADIDTAVERDAEFSRLRPSQRAAVVWAQACSIAARVSPGAPRDFSHREVRR